MNYLSRITIPRIVTLFLLCFMAHISAIAQKDIKGDAIYLMEENTERDMIKIGFINKLDGSKYFINAKVMKHGPFSYIKIGGESYYLDCDASPTMESDICNDLRKIKADTAVKSDEPLIKGITIALLIDPKGDVVTSGIALSANDPYYDNKTLQLLKKYNNDKNIPASLRGRPISYLLRISTVFNQGKCQVVRSY